MNENVERFVVASAAFEWRLRLVRSDQWAAPTPCAEWDVLGLVNHMIRGNFSYVGLLAGGTAAEFLRLRHVDAAGDDPVAAYIASVAECAAAFGTSGALSRTVDYPLGRISGAQALAVRTTDTAVHAWDLARALAVDDRIDPDVIAWVDDNLEAIYRDLAETPLAARSTHRFFAPPPGVLGPGASRQDRLLHRMGRNTGYDRAV